MDVHGRATGVATAFCRTSASSSSAEAVAASAHASASRAARTFHRPRNAWSRVAHSASSSSCAAVASSNSCVRRAGRGSESDAQRAVARARCPDLLPRVALERLGVLARRRPLRLRRLALLLKLRLQGQHLSAERRRVQRRPLRQE